MPDDGNQIFAGLKSQDKLKVFSDISHAGLWKQITDITLPVKIVAIYGMNGHHFAWIQTDARPPRAKK
jgi:hypothetical protein